MHRDWREKELLELYSWYMDWVATAKSVLHKRSYLIALGLASREVAPDRPQRASPLQAVSKS